MACSTWTHDLRGWSGTAGRAARCQPSLTLAPRSCPSECCLVQSSLVQSCPVQCCPGCRTQGARRWPGLRQRAPGEKHRGEHPSTAVRLPCRTAREPAKSAGSSAARELTESWQMQGMLQARPDRSDRPVQCTAHLCNAQCSPGQTTSCTGAWLPKPCGLRAAP